VKNVPLRQVSTTRSQSSSVILEGRLLEPDAGAVDEDVETAEARHGLVDDTPAVVD